jgi:hypothetical protein
MAAIYQWFVGGRLILTTEPYPYEFEETLQTGLEGPVEVIYRQWPIDTVEHTSVEVLGGELIPIRLDMPAVNDTVEHTPVSLIGGELINIRLDLEPVNSTVEHTPVELLGGEILDILIRAQGSEIDLETSLSVEEIIYEPNT